MNDELRQNFFVKIAYGDFGLFKTFWVYNFGVNVLAVAIFIIIYSLSLDFLETPLSIVFFTYTPVIIIGIFNAAKRYEGNKLWSALAQILALLGVIQFARSLYEFFGGLPGTF